MSTVFPDTKGFNPITILKRSNISHYLHEVQEASLGKGTNEYGRIIAALCLKHNLQLPGEFESSNNDIIQSVPAPTLDLSMNDIIVNRPSCVIDVKGDGDCGFRALSVAIVGSESGHYLLRLLAVAIAHKNHNWQLIQRLLPPSGHRVSDFINRRQWAEDTDFNALCELLGICPVLYCNPSIQEGHLHWRSLHSNCSCDQVVDGSKVYLRFVGDHYDVVQSIVSVATRKAVRYNHLKSEHEQIFVPSDAYDKQDMNELRKIRLKEYYLHHDASEDDVSGKQIEQYHEYLNEIRKNLGRSGHETEEEWSEQSERSVAVERRIREQKCDNAIKQAMANMLDYVSSTMDVTNKPADGVAHGDSVDLELCLVPTFEPFFSSEPTAGTSKGTRTSKRQSGKAGKKPDSSGKAVSQSTKTSEGSTKRIRKATRTFDETPPLKIITGVVAQPEVLVISSASRDFDSADHDNLVYVTSTHNSDSAVEEPGPPCSSKVKIKKGTRTRKTQRIWFHSTVTEGFSFACRGCEDVFANASNVCRHWHTCEQNPERDLTQNKCENPKCTAAFPGNPTNLRRHMAAMMTLANGELYCRTKGQSKDSANGVLTPRTRRKRPIADTVQSDEDSDDVAGPRTDTRLKRRKVSAAPRLRVRGDRERGQGPSLYAAEEAALKQKNKSIKAGQPIPAPNRRELRYDLDLKEPTQEELQRHIEHIIKRHSNYGLKITNYTGEPKVLRVYSEVVFYPGDFLALCPAGLADETESLRTGNMLLKKSDSPFYGGLINRSDLFANCRPCIVLVGDTVRVYMQASKIIMPNTELLWDYGDHAHQVNTQPNGHDSDGQMGVSPGVDSVID